MMKIEEIHAENFRLIEEHKIKVGQYFASNHGTDGIGGTLEHIHGMYGWLIFSNTNMPQRVATLLETYRNVDPLMVVHKYGR
jgi:hypothetical protein